MSCRNKKWPVFFHQMKRHSPPSMVCEFSERKVSTAQHPPMDEDVVFGKKVVGKEWQIHMRVSANIFCHALQREYERESQKEDNIRRKWILRERLCLLPTWKCYNLGRTGKNILSQQLSSSNLISAYWIFFFTAICQPLGGQHIVKKLPAWN